jgi:tRNA pseudouridine38-40 synthase
MRTFKLTIAYDGKAYCGWQRQVDKPSVQSTLEDVLEGITGQRPKTLASGRTDAGVHALGQVVGVRVETHLPTHVLQTALNARLPADIAVAKFEEVDAAFHPIRDAVGKRYRYLIFDGPHREVFWRHYCWHYRYGQLDVDAMARAADALLGTHDFRSFASTGSDPKTTVRTLRELTVRRLESPNGVSAMFSRPQTADRGRAGECIAPWLAVDAVANGFLYNMVRTLVGTLVEVGRGARPEAWPADVLSACDRRRAGPTVPPQGLFLVNVWYTPDEPPPPNSAAPRY